MTDKPTCEYCDQTEGLRRWHDTAGYAPQDHICKDCFAPGDTGPDFDDLPPLEEKK